MKKRCLVDDCTKNDYEARGMCHFHYTRWYRGNEIDGAPRRLVGANSARAKAIALGEMSYFTGVPCPKKHVSKRRTSDGYCMACSAYNAKAWAVKNKQIVYENSRRWRKNNKGKVVASARKHQMAKLTATPKWVNYEEIKNIYMEAEYQQMEVDHIIPLQGKNVCGLHCEDNLQLLTMAENKFKSNKLISGDRNG